MIRTRRGLPAVLLLLTIGALLAPDDCLARRKKDRDRPLPFRVVAVVPPRVEITRARVLGGVPKVETSIEVEDLLAGMVEDGLASRGYEVKRGVFSAEARAEDPDLNFVLSDLQERFDEVYGQIVNARDPKKDLEAGRFTLGDAALLAAGAAGVEGLVFVRGQGVSTGGGTKTAVFFLTLGGVPGSGIALRVVSVDGKTGRVMDVVGSSAAGPILKRTEKVVGKALAPSVRALRPPAAQPPATEEPE